MKFLSGLSLILLVLIPAVGLQNTTKAPKLNGGWRIKFILAGLEKNLVLNANNNGTAALKLLDTGPDNNSIPQAVPGVWSQLANDRVSFTGETELPIGTCCREVGTMIFKGKFVSQNSIVGTMIFVTSVDQEESAFKFRSEVGTFEASRITSSNSHRVK